MAEKDKRGEMSEKVAMFLYVMRKELLAFIGATQDMLVVHAFDARGEEAGREEFRWAIEMEGAVDQTKGGMTLGEVGRLQGVYCVFSAFEHANTRRTHRRAPRNG